ncbi:MAG TPA: VOC family protein [Solirubrobacterales bacterium]|nr:VOC family protein [Solirubrobacterales bacterium]
MLTNQMRLDGLDHVTAITADGQRCLDFYAGVLGLEFVGHRRDFEAPESHLLGLAPDRGRPAGILNFIEAPGVARGRAGNGMVHTLSWSVFRSSLKYWAGRLAEAGIESRPILSGGTVEGVRFADPEGLAHELIVDQAASGVELAGSSSAVPAEHAIGRLRGVRAYGRAGVSSADILAGRLGFVLIARDAYEVRGAGRTSAFAFDEPPAGRPVIGAGTIHHVAWAAAGGLGAWRQRVIGLGCRATPVIDRDHRRSIYFREPSGVLFEIAVRQPGEAYEGTSPNRRRISPKVDPRVALV